MTRNRMKSLSTLSLSVFVVVAAFLTCGVLRAQEETDVATSMGVGMQSRFASGATPIAIERTKIIPGTPMTVTSTMSNILSNNNNTASFGGILARYDLSNFGKFFSTGQLQQRQMSERVNQLDALADQDNAVENVESDRMYPPRLVLDFNEFPIHSLTTQTARSQITNKIENAISRFDFDRSVESIKVESVGSTVRIYGQVKSERLAKLVVNVVSMQAGVEEVVNDIEVLNPGVENVDAVGRPIIRKEALKR